MIGYRSGFEFEEADEVLSQWHREILQSLSKTNDCQVGLQGKTIHSGIHLTLTVGTSWP